MDTGQILAVLQPAAATLSLPQQAGLLPSIDQDNGVFAGLMHEMSARRVMSSVEEVRPAGTDTSDPGNSADARQVSAEMLIYALTAFQGPGDVINPMTSLPDQVAVADSSEPVPVTQKETVDTMAPVENDLPQEAFQGSRTTGRRPALDIDTPAGPDIQYDKAPGTEVDGKVFARENLAMAGIELAVQQGGAMGREAGFNGPLPKVGMEAVTGRSSEIAVSQPQRSIVTDPGEFPGLSEVQSGVRITADDRAVPSAVVHTTQPAAPSHQDASAVIPEAAATERGEPMTVTVQRTAAPAAVDTSTAAVPRPEAGLASVVKLQDLPKSAVTEPDKRLSMLAGDVAVVIEAAAPEQQPGLENKILAEMDSDAIRPKQPEGQRTIVNGSSDASVQKPKTASETRHEHAVMTAVTPEMKVQASSLQNAGTATTIAMSDPINVSSQRAPDVDQSPRELDKYRNPDRTLPDAAGGNTLLPGGQATSGDAQDTPGFSMDGNSQPYLPHQQVKSNNLAAVNSTTSSSQGEPPRTVAPEQVVQQVKERLVSHEAKPGNEQIVLRLSPEHLGDLKVNLNLEGQKLRVEIVAENRMVRDSLLQHTDALKESLARQNITMESFDVTAGGNGTADSGRGQQGDWRELAQQRQLKAWMPEGGYRMARQELPATVAYQAKSAHSMVDMHF